MFRKFYLIKENYIKMWGNSPTRQINKLTNIRKIYVSRSKREIGYTQGEKDRFLVVVVEKSFATGQKVPYAMYDKDCFEVIKKYYGKDPSTIENTIKKFVNWIDKNSGNFYCSLGTKKTLTPSPQYFNTALGGSFGDDIDLIIDFLTQFFKKDYHLKVKEHDSELEECLVVVFLTMIAEWYYVKNNAGGEPSKSIWQHRIKLLGIKQTISGDMLPDEAAKWSVKKSPETISLELKKYDIFESPYKLS